MDDNCLAITGTIALGYYSLIANTVEINIDYKC